MLENLGASFRDPSGFVYKDNGQILRQVNPSYQAHYRQLMESGLYEKLTQENELIRHSEVDLSRAASPQAFRVVAPEEVYPITYPYEWCFSQLQDAALLTLKLTRESLEHGMILKDASAFNIQFRDLKPVMIDTLSFEKYEEGKPWVAYQQFCKHFLAPLALMADQDIRLGSLGQVFIDGIPLDMASRLLSWKTRFNMGLLAHIHVHAKAVTKHADSKDSENSSKRSFGKVSRNSLLGMLDNLESTVRKLKWAPKGTEWADYYNDTNYSDDSFDRKGKLVSELASALGLKQGALAIDLGGNTGEFSRILHGQGYKVVSADIDPGAVEINYRRSKKLELKDYMCVVQDLTNPIPALGWAHEERDSFRDRYQANLTMALAIIHHLAISNNVPLRNIARFLAKLGPNCIIEFVPKTDSQVRRLLATREDVFPDYTVEGFEKSFGEFFKVVEKRGIEGSDRILYALQVNH